MALLLQNFGAWLNVKHAIGCNSGSDALLIALKALGIGSGDEVITQANTFIATTYAITNVGAATVLVDCEPNCTRIDVSKIEAAITPKTKAIIPVYLSGQPCDMDPIMAIAKKHGLKVVAFCCPLLLVSSPGVLEVDVDAGLEVRREVLHIVVVVDPGSPIMGSSSSCV